MTVFPAAVLIILQIDLFSKHSKHLRNSGSSTSRQHLFSGIHNGAGSRNRPYPVALPHNIQHSLPFKPG